MSRTLQGRIGNLRVGTKIILTVLVVAAIAAVTSGLAWSRMGSLDDKVQGLRTTNISRLDSLVQLQNGMADMYHGLFLFEVTRTAAEKSQYKAEAKAAQTIVDQA